MGSTLKRLLDGLIPYTPTLIGTYPLGLQVAESDVDLACCAHDLGVFERDLGHVLRSLDIEARPERRALIPEASVTYLRVSGMSVEVFAQPVPIVAQHGFRHMVMEGRLLVLGGEVLRQRVLALKRAGMKTEPAFARLLGLNGDPYAALLGLESWSHAQLADRVASCCEGA